MLLGVIADDFTGAGDVANTVARGRAGQGGLRTTQFFGVPSFPAPPDCEAGVVSLKSRSIPAANAVAQSLDAMNWLLAQGCRQILFKYCSTFNSTTEGNIGPVGEALAQALGVSGVIVCPAFPAAGRTVYQGHLFVADRLLNESGLENHPLNPMTDADIRRWLRIQSQGPIGFVPFGTVSRGAASVRSALQTEASKGRQLVVVDAVSDADLLTIGEAAADARLVTGGSGVALGLPANFIERGLAEGRGQQFTGLDGPEAILAGSCSSATLGQIACHRERGHPTLELDVAKVLAGAQTTDSAVAFIRENEGRAPLIYSSATPDVVRALQDRYGRDEVARRLDAFFAATARMLVAGGLRRLVVAGGETSGAVASALGIQAVRIGPEIDVGVPVLSADSATPLALALKSGNFGGPDFFEKALRTLRGEVA